MRLLIVGQKWLASEVLRQAIEDGFTVTAVAAPAGDRTADAGSAAGIPTFDPGARIEAASVPGGTDLIVCAHAHAFVTAAARERAMFGAIGYHPSLLPLHRGRDSIRWALHMRERITGGTVYRMTDRADAGPVLAQDWCFIHPSDDPAVLWRRVLAPMGARLLRSVLADLRSGQAVDAHQDETLATWEPAFERPSLGRRRG